MNLDEIRAKYLALHNNLGTQKDAADKELFDQQHRQVWINCDIELKTRKNELEAKETLTNAEETELVKLTKMFPEPPPPSRDLAAEIDELKAEVERLKTR